MMKGAILRFLRIPTHLPVASYSNSCETKMRKFFVGGNWKMNGDKASIKKIVSEMCVDKMDQNVEVLIAAPACYLEYSRSVLPTRILLSAQNCYSVPKGAFTGEISPAMIKDVGATWTLIGHSERRHIFKETNEMLAKKVEHAIAEGLSVVFCVGETQEERDANKSEEVVFGQMKCVIPVVKDWTKVVIAYEPVWAIGTGKVATPEIAQDIHCKLRQFLREKIDPNTADNLRIIYGGSVTGDNSNELAKQEDIDGFLVGGASLKPEFLTIVNSRSK